MTEERKSVRVERNFGQESRYNGLKVFLTDDLSNEFFELRDIYTWPEGIGDAFHQVSAGEEGIRGLGIIAARYYGRADLWWVIAEANDILLPTKDVEAGLTLRIPNKTNVFARLLS